MIPVRVPLKYVDTIVVIFLIALCQPGMAQRCLVSRYSLANSADIFFGKAVNVEPEQVQRAAGNGIFRVTFDVEKAVRGVNDNRTFTFRHWREAAQTDAQYQPGQSMLLFLNPLSRLGLTNQAAGIQRRFELTSQSAASALDRTRTAQKSRRKTASEVSNDIFSDEICDAAVR